jgi:ABC-type sugar transport system substrate-binding protein
MVEKKMLRGAMLVVALTGMVMTTPTSVQADPEEKVTICHIPPGNPENAHEITVGASAVPAHLAHGDVFSCGGEGEGGGE